MPIPASDWIAFHADRTPEKIAQIDAATGRQFTYAEMDRRASALAGFLRAAWGVERGDRVAILARNSTEYFEVEFACIKLGALMLPLNWRLAEPEMRFILQDATPIGLIHDVEFAEFAERLGRAGCFQHALALNPGQPSAYEEAVSAGETPVVMENTLTHDDAMTLMYTAGTTGHPKGVLITHGMTLWNAINISTPTGLNCDSVFYCVLPTFHTGGLNLYANPVFHLGGTNIIARQFDPGETLHMLSNPANGITHFFGVPSIYLFLYQHPDFADANLSHVHSWGCGGAPMPTSVLEHYARRGIIIQLGFGMTETSPTVFLIDKRRALQKPTSVGKPLLHTRVRVVDEHFADRPPGQIGEVVISGPNITPGYWKRPDADREGFTVDAHGQRWLHSGDAGMIDDEGCIFIVDRYKDMYISGGENVYPAEVEQVLYLLPEVAEAAVIGIPDARWGESGLAVIAFKTGETLVEEIIIAHCREHLARFKVPKVVVFTDLLPRNAAGKVLKRQLREDYMPRFTQHDNQ